MRVLLVGCGNPLRGDDGAGWHVVEELAGRWANTITIRLEQQLVPEWAADFAAADVAFIVDASSNGKTQITPLRTESPLVDGHAFGPAELLGLTEHVFGRSPAAYLVEVPGAHFEFGEDLSPGAAVGVREATSLLDLCLTALMRNAESPESDASPALAYTCDEPPRQ